MADEKVVRKQKKVRAVRGSRAVASVAALVARLKRARERVTELEAQADELRAALGTGGVAAPKPAPIQQMRALPEPPDPPAPAAPLAPDDAQGEGRWV